MGQYPKMSRALAEQEINTFLFDSLSYLAKKEGQSEERRANGPSESELQPPVALADKLLAQAAKEQNKTTRFVLLSEAVTASSEGGDLSKAFSTVDRIHSSWTVNAFDLKKSALNVFTPAKSPGFWKKKASPGRTWSLSIQPSKKIATKKLSR